MFLGVGYNLQYKFLTLHSFPAIFIAVDKFFLCYQEALCIDGVFFHSLPSLCPSYRHAHTLMVWITWGFCLFYNWGDTVSHGTSVYGAILQLILISSLWMPLTLRLQVRKVNRFLFYKCCLLGAICSSHKMSNCCILLARSKMFSFGLFCEEKEIGTSYHLVGDRKMLGNWKTEVKHHSEWLPFGKGGHFAEHNPLFHELHESALFELYIWTK